MMTVEEQLHLEREMGNEDLIELEFYA